MKIERASTNTFTLAARPTLSPSNWLLRFVKVQGGLEMLCIASAYAVTGVPVRLTFDEVASNPTATDAEVTLSLGQWQLYVYEQTSASNLNYTLAGREVFTTLVEVVGAAIPDPEPTDPCAGSGAGDPTTVNGVESDTPTITVLQGGVQVGTLNPETGVHTVPECEEPPPCDPMTVTINGVEVVNQADPCGANMKLACEDLVDAVVVEGAGVPEADGLYITNLSRIENGKPVYEHSADMGAGDDRRFRITSGGWWALFSNNLTPEASFAYSATSEVPAPDKPYEVLQANWEEDTAPMLPVPTIRQATIADLCACVCNPVEILDQDANVIDTVAAGGTYTVIVVSGIDGGLSNTTYTNSIIQA